MAGGSSPGRASTAGSMKSTMTRGASTAGGRQAASRSRPNTTRSMGGSESLVDERVPATDRDKLRTILIERGNGYVLKGWRREFDLDGTLTVDFQGFCQAAATIHFDGNYHAYFASEDMVLLDVVPEEGALMRRFRQWIKRHFGGPAGMMTDYDRSATKPEEARLSLALFVEGCRRNGFVAEEQELLELYHACDVDELGVVTYDEAIFLELDPRVREMDMFRLKHKAKDQHEKLLANTYKEELKRGLPQRHRLKVRPWLLDQFESLPTVVCQRRVARQRKVQQRHLEARLEFVRMLRQVYGNEIRAWRKGIDVNGAFEIDQKTFYAFCRKHDLDLDIPALWRSMDKNADGVFTLEELCVHTAAILTSFRSWCTEHFGSCAQLWDSPETQRVRKSKKKSPDPWVARWPSDKKMLFQPFQDALRSLALRTRRPWPGPDGNASWVHIVMQSLDLFGCHLISRDDLAWLDKWDPPEWISAEPDEAAWQELRAEMLQQYGHPLKAWRVLLDEDNSNSVSWMEFKHGAEKLKYKGNAVGAWRHLDKDLSGTISMKEYDPESADLLLSFKTWAEEHFGSVETAFKGLDDDGSGSLSLSELRKACKRLRWHGDVKLLFDCLDLDGDTSGHPGKRTLQLKEVSFLDSWGVEAWEEGEKEEFIQTRNIAAARRRSSVASLMSATLSGPGTPSRQKRPSILSLQCTPKSSHPGALLPPLDGLAAVPAADAAGRQKSNSGSGSACQRAAAHSAP
eukprot:CAMPEP_0178463440 /NCGR_PEP_ID=MMETSP0689_2-20121128/50334_1 /TAXON_ID=160604 /ORGANISM="Amphidinium massartii, Strain CS-259" /LENGTH=741 /DNA_ID=CAMNT_0020090323 /DNA_START=32 /DNA_END=2254 /DNA_ORIENTATION=-